MVNLMLLITVAGSAEKLLPILPITGLSGLALRSATGARFIVICMAFSIRAVCAAADDVLRFMTEQGVPFTNNLAEQTVRMPGERI